MRTCRGVSGAVYQVRCVTVEPATRLRTEQATHLEKIPTFKPNVRGNGFLCL